MGTIINVIAVVIGGGIGLFVKGGLPSRMRDLLMQALGLCTMFIGISGAISGMMKVEGATLISGGTMLLIFFFRHWGIIGRSITTRRSYGGIGRISEEAN